jgi:hypothetical protein
VWDHFSYDAVSDKCTCNVIAVEGTDTKCGRKISGKNSTNMKTHLKTCHSSVYKEVEKRDGDNRRSQAVPIASVPPAATLSQTGRQTSTHQGNIATFLSRPAAWPLESPEAERREAALVNLFISTGLARRVVEEPTFREFCRVLDSKFQVPGNHFNIILFL